MSYKFYNQLNNEDLLLLTKQHPLVLLGPMLLSASLLLIPLVANLFLVWNSLFALITLTCLAAALFQAYHAWHIWDRSMLLLTTKRILIFSQKGLVNREMAESGLDYIHRVTHEVKGLLPTMLGYGAITVLTDDTQTALIFPAVPFPEDVQRLIQAAATGEREDTDLVSK